MDYFLRTRGTNLDYSFIGSTPDHWWHRYSQDTSFEFPSFLLERTDDQKWQLFLTGIPSKRRDRVERVIRYDIAASGMCPCADADVRIIQVLVHTWLNALEPMRQQEVGIIGKALDDAFDLGDIERWLGEASNEEVVVNVTERMRTAIDKLRDLPVASSVPRCDYVAWVGRTNSDEHRGMFVESIRDVLVGLGPKRVLLLNLYRSKAHLDELVQRVSGKPTVVLIDIPIADLPSPRSLDPDVTLALRKEGSQIGPNPKELTTSQLSNRPTLVRRKSQRLRRVALATSLAAALTILATMVSWMFNR